MNFLKNWFIIRKEIRKNLLKWIQKQKTTILIKKSLKKKPKKTETKTVDHYFCFSFLLKITWSFCLDKLLQIRNNFETKLF